MNYIVPGNESLERVEKLLELSGIRSEVLIKAIKRHMVNGDTIESASFMFDYDKDNLKRAVNKINKICGIVESIKEMDWRHLNENKGKRN